LPPLKKEHAMRGIVHHIDLTVRDPKASFPFYDAVLTMLGYLLEKETDRGFDWRLDTPMAPIQLPS
jgi:hypothetical protein